MIWGVIIALYSAVGGFVLIKYGPWLFFVYPEWELYGGASFGVAAVAFVSVVALSNRSYTWTRASKFMWPIIVVIILIRAIIMILELQRGQSEIQWECDNGGQLWTSSANAGYASGTGPSAFCSAGYSSLYIAFIAGLVVDIVFQLYMFFLMWRYQKRLEHYNSMKGPFEGGYYNA